MTLSHTVLALLKNPETPYYALRDALAEEDTPVNSVWVVCGRSGSFSSERTWMVAAFLSDDVANTHLAKCNKWLDDHHMAHHPEHGPYVDDEKVLNTFCSELSDSHTVWSAVQDKTITNPHDPFMEYVYDGISYSIQEIPLGSHV